jgi:hypothetical protein
MSRRTRSPLSSPPPPQKNRRTRSSPTQDSSANSSVINRYDGMSPDQIRKRINEIEQDKKQREEKFINSANIESEAKEKERRRKISESAKGKKPSEDTKSKMSDAKKGENNTMFGKTHTKETKTKISRTHLLKQLPETGKEFAIMQNWSHDDIKLQIDLNKHKRKVSKTTTGSTQNQTERPQEISRILPTQPPTGPETPLDF